MSNCCDKCKYHGLPEAWGSPHSKCPCHSTTPTSFVGLQYRVDPNQKPPLQHLSMTVNPKKPDLEFTAPTGDGWESEFDEKFTNKIYGPTTKVEEWKLKIIGGERIVGIYYGPEDIKPYIRSLLSRTRQETQPEVVVCSAVMASDGSIYRGHRHGHAMLACRDEGKELHHGIEQQGFITSKNRYVSRKEARKLQGEAGIPSADKDGYRGDSLFSEDLYQPDRDVVLCSQLKHRAGEMK